MIKYTSLLMATNNTSNLEYYKNNYSNLKLTNYFKFLKSFLTKLTN